MVLWNATDAYSEKKSRALHIFYRREIYRVIGSNTGKIKDIKNEVRPTSPHIGYRLIFE